MAERIAIRGGGMSKERERLTFINNCNVAVVAIYHVRTTRCTRDNYRTEIVKACGCDPSVALAVA